MKEYDSDCDGLGSPMNICRADDSGDPEDPIAVIDTEDEPGGICLTRGCSRPRSCSIQRKTRPDMEKRATLASKLKMPGREL